MTAEPVPAGPAAQPAAGTPREIRAALLPEQVGQFDSAWRAALARAAESLDRGEVYDVLGHGRRIARLTQADPDAHRRMLAKAERTLAGGPEPTRTLDEMRDLVRRRLST